MKATVHFYPLKMWLCALPFDCLCDTVLNDSHFCYLWLNRKFRTIYFIS